MTRSLITVALASAVVGGLGLMALDQRSLAQTDQGQSPPRVECGERRGRGHGDGLATAAAQLGVSEADLKAALGIPAERPPRPDLATAAAQLGVSEADLQTALRSNMPSPRQQGAGERRGHGEALAATAAQLGVSEADLKAALGIPAERPPRPDLATAAAQLGVSEADLQAALRSAMGNRVQRRGPEAQ